VTVDDSTRSEPLDPFIARGVPEFVDEKVMFSEGYGFERSF